MPSESPYRSTLRPEDFAPQRGFNVSIVSIIVYLAGIGVSFFKLGGKERIMLIGGPTMWMVIGGYVGIFLVAMLISFFAFSGTRSRVVSAVFFCLSIPALVYGAMKINALGDAKIKPDTSRLNGAAVVGLPTPVPTPTPATPEPVIPGNPTYTSHQRDQYIQTANGVFVGVRHDKITAFTDAFTAWQTGGGVATKGLDSKEAIAERRRLVAALNKANDDYITFVTNQEAVYRAELEKTPLVPNDVNDSVNRYMALNSDVADKLAVRETERGLLKANDDILAALDSMWGRWKLRDGRAVFEKKADTDLYAKLIGNFNAAVAAQNAAQKKLTASGGTAAPVAPPDAGAAPSAAPVTGKTPSPAPGGRPAASPSASLATPSSSVGAVVTPIGTPASAVSPTP